MLKKQIGVLSPISLKKKKPVYNGVRQERTAHTAALPLMAPRRLLLLRADVPHSKLPRHVATYW